MSLIKEVSMKTIFLLILAPVFSMAATFTFEPYFETNYACNYIESIDGILPLKATTIEQAVVEANSMLNQKVSVTCNQDLYRCFHGAGDVEPRVAVERSSIQTFVVLGGRVIESATYKEMVQLNEMGYHGHLRPMPRCKY